MLCLNQISVVQALYSTDLQTTLPFVSQSGDTFCPCMSGYRNLNSTFCQHVKLDFQKISFRISTKIINGREKFPKPYQKLISNTTFWLKFARNYCNRLVKPFFLLGRLDAQSFLYFFQQELLQQGM